MIPPGLHWSSLIAEATAVGGIIWFSTTLCLWLGRHSIETKLNPPFEGPGMEDKFRAEQMREMPRRGKLYALLAPFIILLCMVSKDYAA